MPSVKTHHPVSVFEVAGPIMVGPSSSHTAGACKIGQIARALFHKTPDKVIFYLHGSFGEVYKGHATDRALLGGIMKFKTGDPRIKDAFKISKSKKINCEFIPKNLGASFHPNTVQIIMEKNGYKKMSVIGSSIGGGMAKLVKIDDFEVNLNIAPGLKSLIVWHDDHPQHLNKLCKAIESDKLYIRDIQTNKLNGKAISIIDTDGPTLTVSEVKKLESLPGISDIRSLTKLEES